MPQRREQTAATRRAIPTDLLRHPIKTSTSLPGHFLESRDAPPDLSRARLKRGTTARLQQWVAHVAADPKQSS